LPVVYLYSFPEYAAEAATRASLAAVSSPEDCEAADAGTDSLPLLASLAKSRLADTFHLVAAEAIQMHGGIGMTDEEEIGFFLKRARVAEQTFGDGAFHRDRYARLSGF
jgi:acyl-CoA dehydrogenase